MPRINKIIPGNANSNKRIGRKALGPILFPVQIFFNNLNLRHKLLLTYLSMTIIPMMIIGIVSYIKSTNTITNQVHDYASLLAAQINKDIDAYIDKLERLTYTTLNADLLKILESNARLPFPQQLDNRDKVNNFLLGINLIDPMIDGTYLYSRNGDLFFENSAGTMAKNYSFTGESWYQTIFRKKTLLIPPHLETKYENLLGNWNFSYVRPLYNIYNSQYLGFILVDVRSGALDEIVGAGISRVNGRLLILDNCNRVIYDSDGILSMAVNGDFLINKLKTKNLIITNQSVRTGWKVVFISPFAVLMEKVSQVRNFTILIMLSCLVLITLASIWISLSISQPLHKLKETIGYVENGDLDVMVEIENDSEIGQLGRSFNKMLYNIRQLINEVYEVRLKKKEVELRALQSQINPHFMYNTLETINMMAVLKGNFEISDVLSAFGEMLRFNIDNREKVVSIAEELRHVSAFLKIQRIRYHDRFTVSYELEPDIEQYQIIKLTLQPLVENAIVHGFTEKQGLGSITIHIRKEGETLIIIIADNGLGITPERLEDITKSLAQEEASAKNGGIGLLNINERIKLYFGSGYGLQIKSRFKEGTEVMMVIPAIIHEQRRGSDL